MADRVLAGDELALQAIRAARPPASRPGLCTIGYEGRTLENYLNRLLQDGVTLLCDVRRNPLSRKYGFSKGTLTNACAGVGMHYEHLPELGIASRERRELNTQADYDSLFAEYVRSSLPQQSAALALIRGWVEASQSDLQPCRTAWTAPGRFRVVAEIQRKTRIAGQGGGDRRTGRAENPLTCPGPSAPHPALRLLPPLAQVRPIGFPGRPPRRPSPMGLHFCRTLARMVEDRAYASQTVAAQEPKLTSAVRKKSSAAPAQVDWLPSSQADFVGPG